MLTLAMFFADKIPDWIPGWLREPDWWRPLTHFVRVFVFDHQAGGLFFVIFLEELGVPLPAPGDAAIAYGGYLTTTGAIPYPVAYFAVVSGAVLGSACNLTISRRYGRPFIQRFGRYICDRREARRGRTLIQAVGPLDDHRRAPHSGDADRSLSFVWNTWRPFKGICTVRTCLCFDLGGDLPRGGAAAWTPRSGPFQPVSGPSDSVAEPGFDLARDRVSGI